MSGSSDSDHSSVAFGGHVAVNVSDAAVNVPVGVTADVSDVTDNVSDIVVDVSDVRPFVIF